MTHRHDVTLSLSCAEATWLARNRKLLQSNANASTAKVSDLLLWALAEQADTDDTYTTTTEHRPDGLVKQTIDFGSNGPVLTEDSGLGKALADLFHNASNRPRRVRWHQPTEDRWEGTVDGHEFIVERSMGGGYDWRHYIPGQTDAYALGQTRALEAAMDQSRQSHQAWDEARKLDEKLAAGDTAGWLYEGSSSPDLRDQVRRSMASGDAAPSEHRRPRDLPESGVFAIRLGADGTVDVESVTGDELDEIDEGIARAVGVLDDNPKKPPSLFGVLADIIAAEQRRNEAADAHTAETEATGERAGDERFYYDPGTAFAVVAGNEPWRRQLDDTMPLPRIGGANLFDDTQLEQPTGEHPSVPGFGDDKLRIAWDQTGVAHIVDDVIETTDDDDGPEAA